LNLIKWTYDKITYFIIILTFNEEKIKYRRMFKGKCLLNHVPPHLHPLPAGERKNSSSLGGEHPVCLRRHHSEREKGTPRPFRTPL